jgi:hypothetical protein
MNDLKKITEGQTGSEVAKLIYDNDTKLYNLIDNCISELDANKAYVAKINSGDSQVLLSVASTTGTSTTDVMSQKAVSDAINNVAESFENSCLIMDTDIPEIGTETSVTSQTTQAILSRIEDLEARLSKLEGVE